MQPLLRCHRLLLLLAQFVAFAVAIVAAFLLRFDLMVPSRHLNHLRFALLVFPLAKLVVFIAFRLHRGWWRYVSMSDLVWVGAANFAGSVLAVILSYSFGPAGFPRSLFIIDHILCFMLTGGMRLATRLVAELTRQETAPGGRKRTIIYGAGDAGVFLLREIRQNRSLPYEVVGFVDDQLYKRGASLHRIRVLGTGEDLSALAEKYDVGVVLIAIPSASGPEMTQILERCHAAGVTFKTIPGMGEVIEGGSLMAQIRDVAVDDLLGRNAVRLEQSAISAKLEDKVILVTGAAGSIGSELCRQIARFHPRAIVAYDAAETPLFHIDTEMRAAFPGVCFHPEIGSVQNSHRLAEVFQHHSPAAVFHAAAYKHVPMMESAIFEAVENNVFGTQNVALAAARAGVEDFVMISSDKAVRPANIMGLTKRVAELLIGALQNGGPKYVSVRFGNVLGSNGSVIPIFKRQIATGGPVTVTHPEMRRFFMTIPEAVQLVLQASTMSSGGEIFVLDMGQPVRILDLARNLILLSGFRPDQDIKIEFSGVRPGEKLYEELSTLEEETLPTYHDKIKIFAGPAVSSDQMEDHLRAIRHLCAIRDSRALLLELKDLVPEYNPSTHILRQILYAASDGKPIEIAQGTQTTNVKRFLIRLFCLLHTLRLFGERGFCVVRLCREYNTTNAHSSHHRHNRPGRFLPGRPPRLSGLHNPWL